MIYLILLTVLSFACFAYDKYQAIHHGPRVSERFLLTITGLGGTLGSLAAMLVFHHKTRKTSFLLKLILLIILQVGCIILICYFSIRLES